MEEKRKMTDEDMAKGVGGIIDDLVGASKDAARNFFNLMVERTADAASDLTDKGANKIKQKLEKRSSDGKTANDES